MVEYAAASALGKGLRRLTAPVDFLLGVYQVVILCVYRIVMIAV